eukprot:TRINITY_DN3430_c0_g1_i1.p1 TRINITY_DN3430_c0_g1~~TRINITY_DN3430_c0_g1_i1.p1  ORF type:complete len:720 (-),score=332.05 TRINITY_DN3430_c0_g1_i1:73-2169(-)
MSTSAIKPELEGFYAPISTPVVFLDATSAFESLTDREKLYSHYISQAAWEGSKICLFQTSPESPALFSLFQRIFSTETIDELRASCEKGGITSEDFDNFLQYISVFYGNLGNYTSFGDAKFIPRISLEVFTKIVETSKAHGKYKEVEQIKSQIPTFFSLEPNVRQLGFPPEGISTYYSANVTKEDAEFVQGFLTEQKLSEYNTRLFKLSKADSKHSFQVRLASSEETQPQIHQYKGVEIQIITGDFKKIMSKVVQNIDKAAEYAANDTQHEMLKKYSESFRTGSIDAHKDSQRWWVKDKSPVVEINIGFIESYRDPLGVRGEWEGFVSVVNKKTSEKFGSLVENAEKLLTLLPWGPEFEKDKFHKPDFTSLEVVTFASSGIPLGINIPNYDDVRQYDGFKNVNLGNVLSSKSNERTTFLNDADDKLFRELMPEAFEVQVGLHELLGHGSGKMLQKNEDGSFNFPTDLIDPTTGKPIASFYLPGQTYSSVFAEIASSFEECRAECVGIFLCMNRDVLKIFGFADEAMAKKILYTNWVIMVRAGLESLQFYNPEISKWGQAHVQARYAILQVLLEAGQGLVEIKRNGDDLLISLNESLIETVGKEAIGNFLLKLQTYRSTANRAAAVELYKKYTDVQEPFLSMRSIVLANKKPRRVFVQAHTQVKNETVEHIAFDPSPKGMIESFVSRFGVSDDTLPENH